MQVLRRILVAAVVLAALPAAARAGWGVGIGFGGPYFGPRVGFGFGYYPYYRPYYPYYVVPPPVIVQPAPVVQTVPVVQPAYAPPPPAAAPPAQPQPETAPAPTPYSPAVPAARQADVEAYLQQLSSPDERTRAEAVLQLGRMKAQRAVEPLVQILGHDRSPVVREAAARGLGLIGAPNSLPALQQAAQADDDRDVRHSAGFAADVIRASYQR